MPVAVIDPCDIAAVAAAVLGREEQYEQVHALSGPAAMVPAERARVLGEVLGRSLVCEAQSDDEARAEMLGNGVPERYVDAFFRFFVGGEFDDTPVLPAVEQLTGRPPRTFEAWAAAHADAFARV